MPGMTLLTLRLEERGLLGPERLFLTLRINLLLARNGLIKAKKPATESQCAQDLPESLNPYGSDLRLPSRSWPAFFRFTVG